MPIFFLPIVACTVRRATSIFSWDLDANNYTKRALALDTRNDIYCSRIP